MADYPTVVGENVPGIIGIAARQVVEDLERAGYHVVVLQFEAAAVGAWHRRSRVFFVGIAKGRLASDAESERSEGQPSARTAEQDEKPREMQPDAGYSDGTDVHNTGCGRFNRINRRRESPELADVSGQLNPEWVEWLMGFPAGWSELEPSAMQLFRSRHTQSSARSRRN